MKRVNLAPKPFHIFDKALSTGKPDHPMIDSFLRSYRVNHGIESVQITISGALWPLKAARTWTEHIAGQKPLKSQPVRS